MSLRKWQLFLPSHIYVSFGQGELIHWGLSRNSHILQISLIISLISWHKMLHSLIPFSLKFFLWSIISQHCFRPWLFIRKATSYYLRQWWHNSLTYICITSPQWVLADWLIRTHSGNYYTDNTSLCWIEPQIMVFSVYLSCKYVVCISIILHIIPQHGHKVLQCSDIITWSAISENLTTDILWGRGILMA